MHLRVYWEDTDAGGIVYHANYIKFMERARSEWLRSKGIGQQQAREQLGGMFVVTNLSLRYLQPARLDDWLWVTASVVERGRASMTMQQHIYRHDEAQEGGTLLCDAQVRIGWVDSVTVRASRIPENVHNLFL
ncbi:tol-pal system-associated acyl-CoA thioesterase [Lampropedia puyangensis]|uniref:Tol-pal system-associated acyl-CoA thioesterase n=1 Tax=Lampropedia puyangensis TaxID=1330072 RepID=A0A4S8F6V9_9BURK|nr:tol-pal system-associated acyl-CoA thioesterase [Lampropedia puyangensis]THU02611.1 tol-pal system-associated acyl-CoA thioesterase [Lampropedia puyangensis]